MYQDTGRSIEYLSRGAKAGCRNRFLEYKLRVLEGEGVRMGKPGKQVLLKIWSMKVARVSQIFLSFSSHIEAFFISQTQLLAVSEISLSYHSLV